jgi:nucleotide-binding universal stress UspA family protein
MRKCAECGKETKKLKFNHVINRWYCKDCWIKLIGPKSAAKAFGEVAVTSPISKVIERQRIKNILVPLDGSKNSRRGLETAVYLAKQNQATLTVIHVVHHLLKGRTSRKRTILQKDIPSFLTLANKIAEKSGIECKSRVLFGDPGDEIINYAHSNYIDLIVMGARGLSLKKIFLGSVSNYVIQKSKTAVTVVK